MRILCCLLIAIFPLLSFAGHGFIGGEITFQDLGNGKYLVYFSAYRNCNSLPISTSIITAKNGSTTISMSNVKKLSTTDISAESLGCSKGFKSLCAGGTTNLGFEKVVFGDTLDISSYSACDWELTVNLTNARETSTGALGETVRLHTMLNKCVANNSLAFTSLPKFVVFQGSNEIINFQASDTNNNLDSISYEFISPLTSNGTPVSYSSSFSYSKPVTFFGFPNSSLLYPAGIQLTNTGNLYFRPTVTGQVFGLCVQVSKWRNVNGQMTRIGYVVRDYEAIVNSTNTNTAPGLQQVSGTGVPSTLVLLAGQSKALSIQSVDVNSGDSTRIIYSSIPGYAIQNSASFGANDSTHILFTPSLSDTTGSIPDTLRFIVEDNVCPGNKSSEHIVLVYTTVKPILTILKDSSCLNWTLTKSLANGTSYNGNLQSNWLIKDGQGQTVTLDNSSVDQISLESGPYNVIVQYGYSGIPPFIDSFSLSDLNQQKNFSYLIQKSDTICEGDIARFTLNYIGDTTKFIPVWKILNDNLNTNYYGSSSMLEIPPAGYDSSRQFLFQVIDNQSCVYSFDTLRIEVRSPFVFSLKDSAGFCDGDSSKLIEVYNSEYQYLWNTNDTTPSLWVYGTGQYSLSVSSDYCPAITKNVIVVATVSPVISPLNDTTLCIPAAINASLISATGAVNYFWNGSPMPQTATYSYLVLGEYPMTLKVIDAFGCYDEQAFVVKATKAEKPSFVQGTNIKVCIDDSVLVEVLNPISGANYSWSSGTTGIAHYLTQGNYSIKIQDSVGCEASENIVIVEQPALDAGFNYTRTGNGLTVLFISNILIPVKHIWTFGDGDSDTTANPSHTYLNDGNYTITHTIIDAQGCVFKESSTTVLAGLGSLNSNLLKAYPNPVRDILNLQFEDELNGQTLEIEIYDSKGALVLKSNLVAGPNNVYQLDLSVLNQEGIYEMIWKSKSFQGSYRLIKRQ